MANSRLRQFIIICILIFFGSGWLTAQSCKEIVGYYASWKWYKRDKLVNPVSIDYSKYSIINYAFFKPLLTGTIVEGDPWADKNILLGKSIALKGESGHDLNSSLIFNAHKNNVKVIASIGGWTWSSAFPGIAADKDKRAIFAKSCISLIRTYNFDGIDIDWEFPGGKLHNGSAADKRNFTLLIREIRSALDLESYQTGKKLMLTAAFGPSPDHMEQIEWEQVAPLLDVINVMTYNYYGTWDKITNHNSPLTPGLKGNRNYAVSSTIELLTTVYKVPASKITMGLAFYGRSAIMNQEPALNALSQGIPDDLTFNEEKGTPSYYNIVAKSHLFNIKWDEVAEVPYMTGKDGLKTFVSFDDQESIKLKAEYAIKMQLLGAVIWDISGDYMETFPGSGIISATPLADALNEAFCRSASKNMFALLPCEVNLLAYPNPFRDEVDLGWNTECEILKILVRNYAGQVVYSNEEVSSGNLRIITSGWTPGWYIIQLLSVSGATGQKILKV